MTRTDTYIVLSMALYFVYVISFIPPRHILEMGTTVILCAVDEGMGNRDHTVTLCAAEPTLGPGSLHSCPAHSSANPNPAAITPASTQKVRGGQCYLQKQAS